MTASAVLPMLLPHEQRLPLDRRPGPARPAYFVARRLSAEASTALDLLRALAAILVMVGHVRGLFFVDFGRVEEPGLVIQAIYFATSLGHEAVMIFFVLSGYFIAGNVLRALGNKPPASEAWSPGRPDPAFAIEGLRPDRAVRS